VALSVSLELANDRSGYFDSLAPVDFFLSLDLGLSLELDFESAAAAFL
jgi:hypothetical protein